MPSNPVLSCRASEPDATDQSEGLAQALRHAGATVYLQDDALTVVWARNAPPLWNGRCKPGARDRDFLPEAEAERLDRAKRRVIATGQKETCPIALPDGPALRRYDVWLDPLAGHGATRGVLTTAVETTVQLQREQTLNVLLREVSHRSKNLLAIIQGIATQTGRYSGSIDTFLSRFRGRLQSLAASQDLVTLSDWRGADLKELVAAQVGLYARAPGDLRFSGENPYLNPNAALHFGLALHELAVNSISYGAFSQPGGSIDVRVGFEREGADEHLVLEWLELVPWPLPPVAVEKRFGSVALERIVPASLRGTAALTLEDGELRYRLSVPAGAAVAGPG